MYPLSFLLKINQECISNMKITSVNVIECKPNVMGKVICVRINTDCKDIYGYGEVGLSYGKAHHAGVGIARDFGEIIVGMDPLKPELVWETIFRSTFWGIQSMLSST